MKRFFLPLAAIILAFAGSAMAATITFDEFPLDTAISDQYLAQGVYFTAGIVTPGLPILSMNGAMPDQPVLRPDGAAGGLYIFQGDFFMHFVNPVTNVSFDSGYWDDLGSGQISVYGPGGHLGVFTNTMTGVETIDLSSLGEINWLYFNSVADGAGADIDNLTFTTPEPASLLLIGIGFGALGLATFRRKRK